MLQDMMRYTSLVLVSAESNQKTWRQANSQPVLSTVCFCAMLEYMKWHSRGL